MNLFKRIRINALVTAIVYVILGLLFVIFPGITMPTLCYIVAGSLAVMGVGYIVDYFRVWKIEYRSNGLAIGILAVMVSLFLFLKADLVIAAIPVLLGFAVIVSGVLKIQNAIVLHRMGHKSWLYVLIAAALCVVLGIVLLENPFAAAATLVVMLGVGLIFSGVSDLVIIVLTGKWMKNLKDQ